MIFLERGPAPDLLSTPTIEKELERLKNEVENKSRQKRLEFDMKFLMRLKPDLLKMSNSKCSYCESKLGPSANGHFDHFRPKGGARGFNNEYAPSHYWWLVYTWDNLFIACELCDAKYKRDWFPLEEKAKRAMPGTTGAKLNDERPLLIDPCKDNPEEHLLFLDSGEVSGLTPKGKTTIEILGLNRSGLVRSRKQAVQVFLMRIQLLTSRHRVKKSYDQELYAYITELFSTKAAQEYAAMQRQMFYKWFDTHQDVWDRVQNASATENESLNEPVILDYVPVEQIRSSSQRAKKVSSNIGKYLSSIKRFSIKSILIENFKSISKLQFTIPPTSETNTRESWLLLLGDNGIGKTSILQAVVLALAGKRQLSRMKLSAKDFLKRGQTKGKVVIYSHEHDEPIVLHFDRKGFNTDLMEPPSFILGYGPTRLLPKGNLKPEVNKEPYLNISNLFDYSVALCDADKWMKKLKAKVFNDRVAPALVDLLALRNGDQVVAGKDGIRIRQYGDDNSLEENSEGYRSVVALAADIMQTLSLDNANYHNSQGIVFIDELGNHLHPRWRLKIVGALRKAFPKLQFIVTTHEPLCLRGVSHGEVVVLVRDANNQIRSLDSRQLPDHTLLRIDQLLTSDLFGLIDVMDEDAEKTFEVYYDLLSKKAEDRSPEEMVQLDNYAKKINESQQLGDTPRQQAFYKLIDDVYAEKVRQDGFKTKEELKKETVEDVKQLILDKKIDWL